MVGSGFVLVGVCVYSQLFTGTFVIAIVGERGRAVLGCFGGQCVPPRRIELFLAHDVSAPMVRPLA